MYAAYVPDFPLAQLNDHVWLDGGQRPVRRSADTRGYKAPFHRALRNSILRDGILNPVNIWDRAGTFYLRYGQSRVEVALDLKMATIPAIVSGPEYIWAPPGAATFLDLTGDDTQFRACFADPPQQWRIHPDGYLDFYKCLGHFDAEMRDLGIWRPSVRRLHDTTLE